MSNCCVNNDWLELLGKGSNPLDFNLINSHLHLNLEVPKFIDNSTSDNYLLTADNIQNKLFFYQDGARIFFIPKHTNTGASTINIDGLGAKDIVYSNGLPITANSILEDIPITLLYSLDNNNFSIVPLSKMETELAYVRGLADGVIEYFEKITNYIISNKRYILHTTNFLFPKEIRKRYITEINEITCKQDGVFNPIDPVLYTHIRNNYYSYIIYADAIKNVAVDRNLQNVKIDFNCNNTIPADLMGALTQHISALYTNRGDCVGGDECCIGIPRSILNLYAKYRVMEFRC